MKHMFANYSKVLVNIANMEFYLTITKMIYR